MYMDVTPLVRPPLLMHKVAFQEGGLSSGWPLKKGSSMYIEFLIIRTKLQNQTKKI